MPRRKRDSTPAAHVSADDNAMTDVDDALSVDPARASKRAKPMIEEKGAPKYATATLTDFQRRVYAMCKRIPKGRVSTYGLLAAAIGAGTARAVGTALKGNPFAPIVPCHRVVRSDLSLGGFNGSVNPNGSNCTRKMALLKGEGITCSKAGSAEAQIAKGAVIDLTGVRLTATELTSSELGRLADE